MTYVVIDHHHDDEAGVYRLVVGCPVVEERPVLDDDGVPLPDGAPDGETAPMVEEVVVDYENVRDYVFAAGDQRWHTARGKRRPLSEIAADQCALAREALEAEAEAHEALPPPAPLPSVGNEL